MIQSTLRNTLSDSLWEQAQARESRYLAAQDAARAFGRQVADVLTDYDFARDDENTRLTASGACTQAAMRLTAKDTGKTLSVACKADDAGATLWFVLDMKAAPYEAGVFIKAVQDRLEANRRARN